MPPILPLPPGALSPIPEATPARLTERDLTSEKMLSAKGSDLRPRPPATASSASASRISSGRRSVRNTVSALCGPGTPPAGLTVAAEPIAAMAGTRSAGAGADNAAAAANPEACPTGERPCRDAPAWSPSEPLPCKDSMRRWKLEIWARAKRCAVSACAARIAVTTASLVGSGRPVTVTVTVPCGDTPPVPEPTKLKLSAPK